MKLILEEEELLEEEGGFLCRIFFGLGAPIGGALAWSTISFSSLDSPNLFAKSFGRREGKLFNSRCLILLTWTLWSLSAGFERFLSITSLW